MTTRRSPTERIFLNNLVWFLGSLLVAFLVWVIAVAQSDPIVEQRFNSAVPVLLTPDAGILVTGPVTAARTARVVVRAPRSVLELLTAEEIVVTAALAGLPPGEQVVPLEASVLRPQARVVDIAPSRLRVMLEAALERQVPLRALVTGEPPAGFAREEPRFNLPLLQVLASGSASRVNAVTAAQVELDLRQQRNPLEGDFRLTPVDADGSPVSDVTLEPATVRVSVDIQRRDDVREISVRPIITGAPPRGYVLNAISYAPQVVLIGGPPDQLAALPDTLATEAIDLRGQTSSFETSVPVMLPERGLLMLSEPSIQVSIEIGAITSSRQFDDVPVEVLGLLSGLEARIAPDRVVVLITGPEAELNRLTADSVRVVLDLNGLTAGNYTRALGAALSSGQIPAANISILPEEVDVEIVAGNR